MKRRIRIVGLIGLATVVVLAACGGGGGDSGQPAAVSEFATATSSSFSPTAAVAKVNTAQAVGVRWTYAVNNGQPVSVRYGSVVLNATLGAVEVSVKPGDHKRTAALQGNLSGTVSGTTFSGNLSTSLSDTLAQEGGRTVIRDQSATINLQVTAAGETGSVKATATVGNLTPAYEWFIDRDNLDQLAVGYTQTITSAGTSDVQVDITGEAPIRQSNVPVSMNDTWTVLEKLPSMTVQGKTWNNVVKLSLQTKMADVSGQLTPVTMLYWVAKGVGMIRGQGVFRVVNVDDVIYELTDTNLTQQ